MSADSPRTTGPVNTDELSIKTPSHEAPTKFPQENTKMDYIVSVPEHRFEQLETAIASLQDEPVQTIPVAVTDDNRATPMYEVAAYYEKTLREEENSYLPWTELPETVRMELGTHLAGCIGWMFTDFTFDCDLSSELDAKFRGNIQSSDAETFWTPLLRP